MLSEKKLFGRLDDGREVTLFTLGNSRDLSVSIINYGATITSVRMPERNGKISEITLGFDNLPDYVGQHPFFGGIVGRFGNRIAGGKFSIGGQEYTLACNDHGIHHLHGGERGFYKVLWQAQAFEQNEAAGITLTYHSADGEEGYPGNLEVRVNYSLNENSELRIEYRARTDKPTPVNLTNHAYWNLAGAGCGSIKQHLLRLNCSRYLPVTETLVPTGEINDVKGTPMDFLRGKAVGKELDQVPGGYDHCFIIDRHDSGLAEAARLTEPESGRCLEVLTTKPAIQFYSGNFLDGITGRDGQVFTKHGGLCLETEYYPDAVHHSKFPNVILEPGREYNHVTVYKLSITDR